MCAMATEILATDEIVCGDLVFSSTTRRGEMSLKGETEGSGKTFGTKILRALKRVYISIVSKISQKMTSLDANKLLGICRCFILLSRLKLKTRSFKNTE